MGYLQRGAHYTTTARHDGGQGGASFTGGHARVLHRVKRTVFLLQDTTYGGVWVSAKNQYYKKYDLIYGQLNLSEANSQFIMQVRDLHHTMSRRVERVRNEEVIDTLIFDHLIEDLQAGFKLFSKISPDDLATRGDHNATNSRTLDDLRRMCNVPTARSASRAEVHFR